MRLQLTGSLDDRQLRMIRSAHDGGRRPLEIAFVIGIEPGAQVSSVEVGGLSQLECLAVRQLCRAWGVDCWVMRPAAYRKAVA